MKKIYALIVLLSSFIGIAQIPTGYYNTATGSGYILKTNLKTIISNDNIVTGTTGYGNLWTLYANELRDNFTEYDNDGYLFDIYTEKPGGGNNDPYNFTSTAQQDSGSNCAEGGCYNREHLVPQSYFEKYALYPMRNDAHHVVPSDKFVNAERGNFPFGKVQTASYTSANGSKKGNNLNSGYSAGYTSTVFEPLDDFKGDVARSFFYFATRYEDSMDNYYTSVQNIDPQAANYVPCKAMFDGSINKVFSDTFLNILLTWHINDPVSNKEISFNNKIYTYQGNRNPYIDHPEFVCQIWSTQCTALNNEEFYLQDKITISPNPSNGTFRIQLADTLETIDLEIYSTLGQKVLEKKSITTQEIEINDLSQGVYLAKFSKNNQVVVKKIVIH